MQFKKLKFNRTQLNWACLLSFIPGIVCLVTGGIFGFEHPTLALILSAAALIFLIISVFLILMTKVCHNPKIEEGREAENELCCTTPRKPVLSFKKIPISIFLLIVIMGTLVLSILATRLLFSDDHLLDGIYTNIPGYVGWDPVYLFFMSVIIFASFRTLRSFFGELIVKAYNLSLFRENKLGILIVCVSTLLAIGALFIPIIIQPFVMFTLCFFGFIFYTLYSYYRKREKIISYPVAFIFLGFLWSSVFLAANTITELRIAFAFYTITLPLFISAMRSSYLDVIEQEIKPDKDTLNLINPLRYMKYDPIAVWFSGYPEAISVLMQVIFSGFFVIISIASLK